MACQHSHVAAVTATADGVVSSGPCWYHGARLAGDGTNVATAVIYDHASAASGTVIDHLKAIKDDSVGEMTSLCVRADNGIYADVTTPGRLVVWIVR